MVELGGKEPIKSGTIREYSATVTAGIGELGAEMVLVFE